MKSRSCSVLWGSLKQEESAKEMRREELKSDADPGDESELD